MSASVAETACRGISLTEVLPKHKLTPGCLPGLPRKGGFRNRGGIRFQKPPDVLIPASPLSGLWLWASGSEGLGSFGGSPPTLGKVGFSYFIESLRHRALRGMGACLKRDPQLSPRQRFRVAAGAPAMCQALCLPASFNPPRSARLGMLITHFAGGEIQAQRADRLETQTTGCPHP